MVAAFMAWISSLLFTLGYAVAFVGTVTTYTVVAVACQVGHMLKIKDLEESRELAIDNVIRSFELLLNHISERGKPILHSAFSFNKQGFA